MARKGENIRKRKDGRWEARYIKGRNTNGSIRYGYVYASKYSEVKQKRDDALKEVGKQKDIYISIVPVPDFCRLAQEWKAGMRHAIKDSSYYFYETIIDHHLEPYFNELPITEWDSTFVQDFIRLKSEENLSGSYIHSMMIIFQSILKSAQQKNNLQIPTLYYQLPKTMKKTPEIFTMNEWKILDKYLRLQTNHFSFGIRLCMYTGLRIGELSGLRWEDIDAVTGELSVRRTVYRIKNSAYDGEKVTAKTKLCISSPKTHSSIREIPLPDFLMKETTYYRSDEKDYIMTGTLKCMEPRNIQKRFRKLLEKCGLRYLNFHSLRHSFATIGIQNGFDYRTLAEILGHSSVNTTLNIYVHSNIERKRECMELLAKQTIQ